MSKHISPVIRRLALLVILLAVSTFVATTFVDAQNGHGGTQTRLLRTPTVSSTQIGFAYANNIWVVPAPAAAHAA
jgi:hypothetical protein